MSYSQPTFMKNIYDSDGDLVEEGVYLCLEGITLKVADDRFGFTDFIIYLQSMESEIHDT